MPREEQLLHRANETSFALPSCIRLFVRLIVLFTALPLLYLLELHYLGTPKLMATLWSAGPDRFGDFWHYRALLQLLHKPDFFAARDRFAYPAPCALLFQLLYHLGPRPHVSFNLVLWAIEAGSAFLLYRALQKYGLSTAKALGLVLLLVVTSYPWHFLYDRGNIEVFVYLFTAGGVWAWLKGYEKTAAILWGLSGSLKLYPILMLAMFFRQGQWKQFFLGLFTCCAVLWFSFWYVGPTVQMAATGTFMGVLGFVGHYGTHARSAELVFDHSILGAVKEIFELPSLREGNGLTYITRAYEAAVILVGPWAFLKWRRSAPQLNQLCLLLLALLLLPPVSYDYTLIYAYLVLGIVLCCLVDAARTGDTLPGATSYVVAFALVCTAEDWLDVHDLHPNGLIKCCALLVVAVNVIRYPLRLSAGAGSTPAPAFPRVQHSISAEYAG